MPAPAALCQARAVLATRQTLRPMRKWFTCRCEPIWAPPPRVQAISAITKFLQDQGLAGKPVYLAGASSGGTFALKLPATLYLAAKSAGALSLEQASAMAEAFNGTAASVPDLAGALAAAASASGVLGMEGNATGRANATAAPFYLQVHGIITGEGHPRL